MAAWSPIRTRLRRDAFGIALATGAYAVSFGAISVASGLDVWQTVALSAVMFSGGSQFGLVGVVAGGGAPLAGALTAVLLGVRNGLYGLRMAPLLRAGGWRRPAVAQLVIDETTAMALAGQQEAVDAGRPELADRAGRFGFFATGIALFTLWNLGTLIGALGAEWLPAPTVLGLDAAVPAAFLALLAPRLRHGGPVVVALLAAAVAVAASPFVPVGIPVLLAALVGVVVGWVPNRLAGQDALR
ncbi:AzlC family ABC transporter permease [Nakamurella sp. YIM 132084]|uniref:AzlC family ABC transporter permease n=1 Tax=Nakamurella leprariae TaxID=2803911 RepID=A0A938YAJ4_9ACTN|nr:AzlC family ABC transporter permease [Nakamurella leprariae]